MPCAAGDLCQLPNEELIAPNGRVWLFHPPVGYSLIYPHPSNSAKRKEERMAGIVAEEIDPSDDEKELNESGDAESGGGRKVEAPPPYSDLSSCFGPLEQKAESAGNSEAAHFLRKAKMAFLAAHAAKPTRQAVIRMFSQS